MVNYKYLDHTADVKIQAWGKDLAEAFTNGAYAMFNLLLNPEKIAQKDKRALKVKAKSKDKLLYEFIDELIFHLSVDGFLLAKIEDIKISKEGDNLQLTATIFGDYWKNYEVSGDIKSATYNDMFIKEEKDQTTIQFVVDI